ncbi:MAG: NAD-dependent epimerase/dehydratase family protein [Nevskia sp.]|nr:NAD-dependent epimerase/dehydratase family protein [Nevskia sp.]
MRIFVTGGSGFVGGTLIRFLAERGHAVRALARSDDAVARVAVAGAGPVAGDLFAAEALRRGMQGCDAVIHGAALMKFNGREGEMARVNVEGTRSVLEAARAAGVPRFVAVGAAAVLSSGCPVVNVDESMPVPPVPTGAYAQTKARADRLVLDATGPGFAACVIRPPAVWGTGDPFMLPALVKAVHRGRFVWIDGGRYLFSFCHVRNVCEAALLAAERGRGGADYLVCDAPPHPSLREFFSALLETQGLQAPRTSLPRAVAWPLAAGLEGVWALTRRRGAPPLSRAGLGLIGGEFTINDARARRELGYTAHVSRAAGLEELAAGGAAVRRSGCDNNVKQIDRSVRDL